MDQALDTFYQTWESWLHDRIGAYVDAESPTARPDLVDQVADLIEADFAEAGARLTRLDRSPRPVIAHFGEADPRLVLVFHHDTVWPVGSFTRSGHEGPLWYGPGIFDMKANLPMALLCLRFLREHRPELAAQIMVVSSPDEEIMGPVSRTCLPEHLKTVEWALVFEPPLPNGHYKQKRKGIGHLTLRFTGRATHAGNHYASGISALKAAARYLLEAEALTDLDEGFTVNIGLLEGGSAVNTRPAEATTVTDVRVTDPAQWDRYVRFTEQWRDPDGATVSFDGPPLLPPMNAQHEGWDVLADLHRRLDLPFGVGTAGGGSDGSHLSASGIKVLDGLGIPGAGEHAENEHIDTRRIAETFKRTVQLLIALLE